MCKVSPTECLKERIPELDEKVEKLDQTQDKDKLMRYQWQFQDIHDTEKNQT